MIKKITLLLGIALIAFTSCDKDNSKTDCLVNQICSAEFAAIFVTFKDKDNNDVVVKDFTVVNLRTGKPVVAADVLDPGFSPFYHYVATDSNKSEFSADGDNVRITATSVATNKTVTSVMKISGGCNCHVMRVSGANSIFFE